MDGIAMHGNGLKRWIWFGRGFLPGECGTSQTPFLPFALQSALLLERVTTPDQQQAHKRNESTAPSKERHTRQRFTTVRHRRRIHHRRLPRHKRRNSQSRWD